MPDHQLTPASSRQTRVLRWAERLFLTGGVAALVWCAVFVGDAVVAQRRARHSLEPVVGVEQPARPARDLPGVPPTPAIATTAAVRGRPALARGAPIGALSIPRVHLSAVVLHGSDARTLRRGPGHLENSARPGDPGNMVIAGHRDSFFRPLRHIRAGDDIFLEAPEGTFHYRVTSVRVVQPGDLSVLAKTRQSVLTLITCYPFSVFGNAPERFVVRATAVIGGAAAAGSDDHGSGGPVMDIAPVEPVRVQPATEAGPAIVDDELLVRQLVERFRITYNGRLISRGELGMAGLLTFDRCEVTLTGDRGVAACESRPPRSSPTDPTGRTFMLERSDAGWAIKSILVE